MPAWSIQPLRSVTSAFSGALGSAAPTTSYSIPFTSTGTQYRSTGGTLTGLQPSQPTTSYRSTVNTGLSGFGSGFGSTQPGTNVSMQTPLQRPAYQPSAAAPGGSTAPTGTATRSGVLTQPGAYEQWYAQNASRYNQPTTLNSYWQSISGQFGGQRYQPTTSRDAYSNLQGMFSQPGQGTTNAYSVAGDLRNATEGEGLMNTGAAMLGGVNNTAQYYGDNRGFFEGPGAIEDYYAANGDRFQQAGFGENYAQGILGDPALTGMFGQNLVGDELDYFRDPLRAQSYSEQLYESGNEGLNQWYDLQRQRQQTDLENQMSAMGVFGSGETAEAMYRMREGLAAEQARDMATLAGQADAERRARAGLLMDFSGAATQEDLARGGLMLDSAGLGLQLDRDAISRLMQGGQLADASSRYALDRTVAGGDLARSADDVTTARGIGIGDIGQAMSAAEIDRLMGSGQLGLSADAENRLRAMGLFDAGATVDRLGLDAQAAQLDWLMGGGQLAGNVDRTNLDWLNAGAGAASQAQNMFETRSRYGFTDPLAAADSMAGRYGTIATNNTNASQELQAEAINLIAQREGLSASGAQVRAQQLLDSGMSWIQIAQMFGGG